jgi:hypothetical protein
MNQRAQPADNDTIDDNVRTVSRRAFFSLARVGLIAAAGVAVFGVGNNIPNIAAKESSDEDSKEKEKDSKEKPRDKDQEAKEKERESKEKEKAKEEKKAKKEKTTDNGSNTKKKTKKKSNETDKEKKRKNDPIANSPHGKYIIDGKDAYGCKDMPTQADAQAVLRLVPKDPNNLDGNANGIACDGNDAFMDGVPGGLMQPTFDVVPVPRPK